MKQKTKEDWKAREYAKMFEDMEKHRDLRVPKLKFPKLHWPTFEEHELVYNEYFEVPEIEEQTDAKPDYLARTPERVQRDSI